MNIKTHIYAITLLLLLSVLIGCSSNKNKKLEEPKYAKSDIYIKHYAYSLVYNEQKEQASWLAYELRADELRKKYKRMNNFRPDTMVHSQTANNADYYKSGYDRGHLAPAADMTWNKQAMSESFLYSNMSPQQASFNRGIWKRLESKVRKLAAKYDNIYVCVGPLYLDSTTTIGNNKVAVPSHYYKALLLYNDTVQQSIAFVMPNKKSKERISHYAITVDSLETIIKLDLFHQLANNKEKIIENSYDKKYWDLE